MKEIYKKRLKSLIKEHIEEALEALKGENASQNTEVINDLYSQYLKEFKKIPPKLRNNPYYDKSIHLSAKWNEMYIRVHVTDKDFKDNTKPAYDGAFIKNSFGNSIDISINFCGIQDYNTFREIVLHEMTHYYDDARRPLSTTKGADYLIRDYLNGGIIRNIIYRLWIPTERNAYTTKVLDNSPERYKNYIQSLQNQIQKIADKNDYDDEQIEMWYTIGHELFPNKISTNTSWQSIKNYFVKKSYFLLSKFEEKCIQRYGKYINDDSINPDMKEITYNANHYDDIKIANERALYFLIKNKSFDEYFNYLQEKGIKISKTRAKKIFDDVYEKYKDEF